MSEWEVLPIVVLAVIRNDDGLGPMARRRSPYGAQGCAQAIILAVPWSWAEDEGLGSGGSLD